MKKSLLSVGIVGNEPSECGGEGRCGRVSLMNSGGWERKEDGEAGSISDTRRLEGFEASSPGVGGGRGTLVGVPRGRPAVRSREEAGVMVTELAAES